MAREAVAEQEDPQGGTYRLELVRCGKERCTRCADGPAHGPYWYRYYRGRGGKLVSRYVGKELPAAPPPGPDGPEDGAAGQPGDQRGPGRAGDGQAPGPGGPPGAAVPGSPAGEPRPRKARRREPRLPRIATAGGYEVVKAPDHAETASWQVMVDGVRAGRIRRTWEGRSRVWAVADPADIPVRCIGQGATPLGNARTRDTAARELLIVLMQRQERAASRKTPR